MTWREVTTLPHDSGRVVTQKSPRLLARGLQTAPLRLPLASGKGARERIIRQESPRL